MKRDRVATAWIAAAVSFCISFGGAACLITGFSMDDHDRFKEGDTASILMLAVLCVLFCVIFAVWFSGKRKRWLGVGIGAAVLGILWLTGILGDGIEALVYRLSYTYGSAYGFPGLRWGQRDPMRTSPDVGIGLLAVLASMATANAICRRKNVSPAVGAGLLPLALCLVVTDTVPDNWCIFLLIAGLALLLLTQTVRIRSAREGNRLTALLLAPVILATSVLFWAVPRETYGSSSDEVQQKILSWFQSTPFVQLNPDGSFGFGFGGSSYGTVDLSTVGPKANAPYAVMDVTAAETGTIYLRGQSLDHYTGKAWEASNASTGGDTGWTGQSGSVTVVGDVTISTRGGQPLYYFPYYPMGANWENALLASEGFDEGRVNNPKRDRIYTFTQRRLLTTGTGYAELSGQMAIQCLQLPDSTYGRAKVILGQIPEYKSFLTVAEKVRVIGKFVENSATYSLATKRMPSHESDFALWFLMQADTGYCVHFASAATVLLRAAGVPARYVTGYMAHGIKNQEVTVTADDAHAWVEYFDSRYGWRVLDPTPGSGEVDDPYTPPTETTQPQQTDPDQTTGPSHDTQPDDTDPTDPDLPKPTTPVGGAEQPGTKPKPDLSWLWMILKVQLWICAAVAVIFGQYRLRLALRRKNRKKGSSNKQVLALWQEVLLMCRILRKQPPEELLTLAEKAKFSQHTMRSDERMAMTAYLGELSKELAEKPWYEKIPIKLIFAVA